MHIIDHLWQGRIDPWKHFVRGYISVGETALDFKGNVRMTNRPDKEDGSPPDCCV